MRGSDQCVKSNTNRHRAHCTYTAHAPTHSMHPSPPECRVPAAGQHQTSTHRGLHPPGLRHPFSTPYPQASPHTEQPSVIAVAVRANPIPNPNPNPNPDPNPKPEASAGTRGVESGRRRLVSSAELRGLLGHLLRVGVRVGVGVGVGVRVRARSAQTPPWPLPPPARPASWSGLGLGLGLGLG